MTLGRYMVFAIVFFLAGLMALYVGVNRVPFRQAPQPERPAKQHGQAPLDRITAGKIFCLQDRLLPGT